MSKPKNPRAEYDMELVHKLRNEGLPWSQVCEVAGGIPNTMRGKYSRWLRTERGQEDVTFDAPPPAYCDDGNRVVFESDANGRYLFGVAGDRHHASKYHRQDVLEDLYRRFREAQVQAVLDTGNWIDGECRFNIYDLVERGLTPQVELMARETPQINAPTFAVWGDDHEGWYAKREGIDIGEYAEGVMRRHGHDWVNLGYMEAHVILRHAKSGKEALMAVMHPGGGSSYALSYRPQKIVESMEGGEKPAVIVMGHYHKLEALNVRNVWVVQAGCVMDQSPFMRKKSIEAHVGGVTLGIEQDEESGAIVGMSPSFHRYFNAGFYDARRDGRWSLHGPVNPLSRTVVPFSRKGS